MANSPRGGHWRSRSTASPAPIPAHAVTNSISSPNTSLGHSRNQSYASGMPNTSLTRSNSRRTGLASIQGSGTFAPKFIKTEDDGRERVDKIEGENDFSGKRYVWLRDEERTFVQGWVVEELSDGKLLVQCDDDSQRTVESQSVDKVNPAKFDKVSDMAELTHLNEASVVHNLDTRYQSDLIYTYSGLFLVAVNPYCPLPIYTRDYINMYRGRAREDTAPHIYSIADEAFRNLVEERENQSILVTGESGAGKTENTKKVIQYLAAVATTDSPARSTKQPLSNLSQQILRANPILESFGNAQTVRNNNSSRFGKFIRIEFTRSGQIAGAFIDWYLLEKSRVVKVNSNERNYHIFYQLLRGADSKLKRELLLDGASIEDFEYTKHGNDIITGVDDQDEWNSLLEAFHIVGFSELEQRSILRTVAAVLVLGNIQVARESIRAEQASLDAAALLQAERASQLLGIPTQDFVEALLHPRVKAGREIVKKAQTPEQVRLSIDALAKGIYERGFGDLVDHINKRLNRAHTSAEDTHFIGVLDIAGFEIFEENSFEQLCINYTNEKLQQFFNHHMFVLEQEEYAREQIEWKFIDFGKDLQPTIDLIELSNPIGIFSCLDEDSVMPKATDKSFTDKLHSLWDRKTPKYHGSMLKQGFVLTHYAAEVEYSTSGWLEKNKDPLNDNVTRLLAASTDKHVAQLFADCADMDDEAPTSKSRVKKGLFRTVAQRHKEQLTGLMGQLHSTHPHFVRCIIPNHKKRPKLFNTGLVLDQLRCNGVLEGIRIARTGFPNRLSFAEFRSRYEVLCTSMPKGYLEGQTAAKIILEKLNLDPAFYRVGLTKVFFRAGILAELEEQRDSLIREIMSRFQSVARGFTERRAINKRLYRAEAARIIQRNFQVYLDLQGNPWWKLFVRMRPLLGATRQSAEMRKREEQIQQLEARMVQEATDRQRLDEERRKTESAMLKIQETLESERALALDKEEIFKRLQTRENELNEKLAGALEDQDALEDQMDQLLEAKKSAETNLVNLRRELEQAGQLMSGLESEKSRLSGDASDLRKRLQELEETRSKVSVNEERLDQEVRMLTSQLSMKDRKLQDLEGKVVKADQDLHIKLSETSKELQASKKEAKQYSDENQTIRQQLSEVTTASTRYEDALRLRDSELAILRTEIKSFASDRKNFDEESRKLSTKHDILQSRMRDVQGEMDAMKSHRAQLEREAQDASKALQEKLHEDEQAGQSRRLLEKQVEDLREQIYTVQADLGRERQSRDDVSMLSEHQVNTLKRDHEALNQAKITIEKELYAQQDVLRRTIESRTKAEQDRKDLQDELRSIRQRFLELQEAKLEAQSIAERNVVKLAQEKTESLNRELETRDDQLAEVEADRNRFSSEVQRLKQLISDSELHKTHNDQHKERLERELVTIKGRLTASENDNRSLLNKVQQKNLDIARSNSRASDSQRSRVTQLQAEKTRQEEVNKQLSRQLEDSKLSITSLEKQKEKLELSLEDLNHEIAREHKSNRNAEKTSSNVNLQLAEANRKLETERQLRAQAQANNRTIQSTLDNADKEIEDYHQQLLLLQKVFNPEIGNAPRSFENIRPQITKTVDIARRLEDAENATKLATERFARAEAKLEALREKHGEEMSELDGKHATSKRALLEELDNSQVNARRSPGFRGSRHEKFNGSLQTPAHRQISNARSDSVRSDRTLDSGQQHNRTDLVAEIELLQNQLQMTEMRNRHLQAQIDRSPTKNSAPDESPSLRRMQRLEKENFRLHDMLDDSAQKVSALENSIRTGQLTLKEVQTKSHEELYDLINSQENSRRSLLQVHNNAVGELADSKQVFDDLKQAKATKEVELRDALSELEDLKHEREQDELSRSQLLQEFSELQIKLDTETSNLQDVNASLNLYKGRADEYFNKLEQAEIAVLKASRAEQFAKSQAREAEETCATIMAERKHMDGLTEDLQRQVQSYEEKMEDVSADLDGALQSKKRLQNELEDYRSQRAMDLEDRESSVEQTRRKYQTELTTVTGELQIERDAVVAARGDNSRLRDEIEELRSKWDDEVLNSSTWAKEKSRLEMTLESLSNSRDEAANAHSDAQSKIVSLLQQVRSLRTSVDETSAERDALVKEKKSLETRLTEASERLDDLSRSESPTMRNAAGIDRELLQLKSDLARQEDISSAAVGKMRRSEALAQEVQKEIAAERETNMQLHKDKAGLDKTVKDLQLKLVDLETKGYSSGSQDVRFLHGRIQELEKQLEGLEDTRNKEQRSVRGVDRTVKDLQAQIERREKTNAQLTDDIGKSRDKIERLLSSIDELQSSDSSNQLQAKRAERELREEREKSLRLEREIEGWKGLRMERDSLRRSGTFRAMSVMSDARSVRGGSIEAPQRQNSGSKASMYIPGIVQSATTTCTRHEGCNSRSRARDHYPCPPPDTPPPPPPPSPPTPRFALLPPLTATSEHWLQRERAGYLGAACNCLSSPGHWYRQSGPLGSLLRFHPHRPAAPHHPSLADSRLPENGPTPTRKMKRPKNSTPSAICGSEQRNVHIKLRALNVARFQMSPAAALLDHRQGRVFADTLSARIVEAYFWIQSSRKSSCVMRAKHNTRGSNTISSPTPTGPSEQQEDCVQPFSVSH
ncbi:hypothetical protein FH972_025116 [Carpinus fangiana]|uniref:Myosin motor domain-containing protein n=1 Tax=Carpinus fangiana TaxID=176857 RepID=A0A5N6L033_9ROSI|nr:hypothetical protein FH972_025116 [Carpinus fangiana]